MENVIFHGISIIILVYLLGMSAFNFIYKQHFLGVLLFVMCFALIILYYNSRFRRRFKVSYFLFGLFCYPVIGLNFYLNDGIEGPSAYVFLMFHIIMMVLSSKRQYGLWIAYNALIFTVLLYIDPSPVNTRCLSESRTSVLGSPDHLHGVAGGCFCDHFDHKEILLAAKGGERGEDRSVAGGQSHAPKQ